MATATIRRSVTATSGHGLAQNVKAVTATVELAASATGTTINFFKLPSNARILGASKLYTDDLATTSTARVDLGFSPVDGNITADPDALHTGIDVATAGTYGIVTDIANYGKRSWEYVNGQSTDPGGELQLYGTVTGAATTATGTMTLEVLYSID